MAGAGREEGQAVIHCLLVVTRRVDEDGADDHLILVYYWYPLSGQLLLVRMAGAGREEGQAVIHHLLVVTRRVDEDGAGLTTGTP